MEGAEMNFLLQVATEPNIDFNYFFGLVKDILEIAKKIPGTAGMIFTALGMLLILVLLISYIVWSWHCRQVKAFELDQKITKEEAERAARLQIDLAAATIDIMEDTWLDDYHQFIKAITDKKYADCYRKFARIHDEAVSKFIYNDVLSPETRSALIIAIMRNAKNG
jgi:hypothetical protein